MDSVYKHDSALRVKPNHLDRPPPVAGCSMGRKPCLLHVSGLRDLQEYNPWFYYSLFRILQLIFCCDSCFCKWMMVDSLWTMCVCVCYILASVCSWTSSQEEVGVGGNIYVIVSLCYTDVNSSCLQVRRWRWRWWWWIPVNASPDWRSRSRRRRPSSCSQPSISFVLFQMEEALLQADSAGVIGMKCNSVSCVCLMELYEFPLYMCFQILDWPHWRMCLGESSVWRTRWAVHEAGHRGGHWQL